MIERIRAYFRQKVTNQVTEHPIFQARDAQINFLLNEMCRINEERRAEALGAVAGADGLAEQTRASFDYQWAQFAEGIAMPSDADFMAGIEDTVMRFTEYPREWFAGKRVLDIGCGAGRWTYALLKMGADVTAVDQSEAAVRRTTQLAATFADRLTAKQVNLLDWDQPEDFDLVFCFGVVHHTGNTYLAIRNAASKVKPGGRIFLMVYGFPREYGQFSAHNEYWELRRRWRLMSFEERKREVVEKFGAFKGHGWFDQVSPQVNDLLTFEEIADLLTRLGLERPRITYPHDNHHLVADRPTGAGTR